MIVTNGGKHAVYNTFQALLDPGDEVLLPAPYWTTYPEAIQLADGVPVELLDHRGRRLPRHRRAARGGAHRRAPRRWCSCRRATRPAPCTREAEVEAIGRWAVEHGIWVVTDEIYEHLTYDGHEFTSMPVVVPELADTCVVLNGVAKTYAMTGLARRLDDRPARRHRGRRQPAVAPDVERDQRRASAPRSPRSSGDLVGRRGDARRVRPARAASMHEHARRASPASPASTPRGRVLLLPVVRGRARPRARRPHARDHARAVRGAARARPRSRSCPGEAFGAPGYARLSFALGDDDLVEGVERIADFLAPDASRLIASPPMARVLVTEKLAESGLDAMRAAGLEVDVRLGLSPERAARRGARARTRSSSAARRRSPPRCSRRATSSSSSGRPASASTTSTSRRPRAAA